MIFKDSVTKDSIVRENDSQQKSECWMDDFSSSDDEFTDDDDLFEDSDSIMIQSESQECYRMFDFK